MANANEKYRKKREHLVGSVYLIQCGRTNYYKIGYAKDVKARMKGIQCDNPFRICLIFRRKGGWREEEMIHSQFKKYRVRGEWFRFEQRIIPRVVQYMRNVVAN